MGYMSHATLPRGERGGATRKGEQAKYFAAQGIAVGKGNIVCSFARLALAGREGEALSKTLKKHVLSVAEHTKPTARSGKALESALKERG